MSRLLPCSQLGHPYGLGALLSATIAAFSKGSINGRIFALSDTTKVVLTGSLEVSYVYASKGLDAFTITGGYHKWVLSVTIFLPLSTLDPVTDLESLVYVPMPPEAKGTRVVSWGNIDQWLPPT